MTAFVLPEMVLSKAVKTKPVKHNLGSWQGLQIIAIGPKNGKIIGYRSNGKPIYAGSPAAEKMAAQKKASAASKKKSIGAWLEQLGIGSHIKGDKVFMSLAHAKLLSEHFGFMYETSGNAASIKVESAAKEVGKPLTPSKDEHASWAAEQASGDSEYISNTFPDLSTLKFVKQVKSGQHEVQLFKDGNGKEWYFKYDNPTISRAEEAATRIGRLIMGGSIPATKYVQLNGEDGALQEAVGGTEFNASSHSDPPTKYLQKYASQIIGHQVVDWLVSNHDGHAGNFLADGNEMNAIDKGQAWKFFGKDKLSATYSPNNSNPIYVKFWKEFQEGKIDPAEVMKGASEALSNAAKISPEQFRLIVAPYISTAAGHAGWTNAQVEERLQAMTERLADLKLIFDAFLTQQFKKTVSIPLQGQDNFETMPETQGKQKMTITDPSKPKVVEPSGAAVTEGAAGWPQTQGQVTVHHPGDPTSLGAKWPSGVPGPGYTADIAYKKQKYSIKVVEGAKGKPAVIMTYPDGFVSNWSSPAKAADSMALFDKGLPLTMNAVDKKKHKVGLSAAKFLGFKAFQDEWKKGVDKTPSDKTPFELEKDGDITPGQGTVTPMQLLAKIPDGTPITDPGMIPHELQGWDVHEEMLSKETGYPAAIPPGVIVKSTGGVGNKTMLIACKMDENDEPMYWAKVGDGQLSGPYHPSAFDSSHGFVGSAELQAKFTWSAAPTPSVGNPPPAELPPEAKVEPTAPTHHKGPVAPGTSITKKKKFPWGKKDAMIFVSGDPDDPVYSAAYVDAENTIQTKDTKSLSDACNFVWFAQKGYKDLDDYKAKNPGKNKPASGAGWKFWGVKPGAAPKPSEPPAEAKGTKSEDNFETMPEPAEKMFVDMNLSGVAIQTKLDEYPVGTQIKYDYQASPTSPAHSYLAQKNAAGFWEEYVPADEEPKATVTADLADILMDSDAVSDVEVAKGDGTLDPNFPEKESAESAAVGALSGSKYQQLTDAGMSVKWADEVTPTDVVDPDYGLGPIPGFKADVLKQKGLVVVTGQQAPAAPAAGVPPIEGYPDPLENLPTKWSFLEGAWNHEFVKAQSIGTQFKIDGVVWVKASGEIWKNTATGSGKFQGDFVQHGKGAYSIEMRTLDADKFTATTKQSLPLKTYETFSGSTQKLADALEAAGTGQQINLVNHDSGEQTLWTKDEDGKWVSDSTPNGLPDASYLLAPSDTDNNVLDSDWEYQFLGGIPKTGEAKKPGMAYWEGLDLAPGDPKPISFAPPVEAIKDAPEGMLVLAENPEGGQKATFYSNGDGTWNYTGLNIDESVQGKKEAANTHHLIQYWIDLGGTVTAAVPKPTPLFNLGVEDSPHVAKTTMQSKLAAMPVGAVVKAKDNNGDVVWTKKKMADPPDGGEWNVEYTMAGGDPTSNFAHENGIAETMWGDFLETEFQPYLASAAQDVVAPAGAAQVVAFPPHVNLKKDKDIEDHLGTMPVGTVLHGKDENGPTKYTKTGHQAWTMEFTSPNEGELKIQEGEDDEDLAHIIGLDVADTGVVPTFAQGSVPEKLSTVVPLPEHIKLVDGLPEPAKEKWGPMLTQTLAEWAETGTPPMGAKSPNWAGWIPPPGLFFEGEHEGKKYYAAVTVTGYSKDGEPHDNVTFQIIDEAGTPHSGFNVSGESKGGASLKSAASKAGLPTDSLKDLKAMFGLGQQFAPGQTWKDVQESGIEIPEKKKGKTKAQKEAEAKALAEAEAQKAAQLAKAEEQAKKAKEVAEWLKDYPGLEDAKSKLVLAHFQDHFDLHKKDMRAWARSTGKKGEMIVGSPDAEFAELIADLEKSGGLKTETIETPLGTFWKVKTANLAKSLPGDPAASVKGPDGKTYPKGTTWDKQTKEYTVQDLLPHEPGFYKIKAHKTDDKKAVVKVANTTDLQKKQLMEMLLKYKVPFEGGKDGGPIVGSNNVLVTVNKADLEKIGKTEVTYASKSPPQPKPFVSAAFPTMGVAKEGYEGVSTPSDLAAIQAMDIGKFGHSIRLGKAGTFINDQIYVRKVKDPSGIIHYEIRGELRRKFNPYDENTSMGESKSLGLNSAMTTSNPDNPSFKLHSFKEGMHDESGPHGGTITNDKFDAQGFEVKTAAGSTVRMFENYQALKNVFTVRIPENANLEDELSQALTKLGVTDTAAALQQQTPEDERIALKWAILKATIGPHAWQKGYEADKVTNEAWLDERLAAHGVPKEAIASARFETTFDNHQSVKFDDPNVKSKKVKFVYMGMSEEGVFHQILDGSGWASRNTRYLNGIEQDGASATADMKRGGANGVFARVGTSQHGPNSGWGLKCGGWKVVWHPRILERADWRLYHGDSYGNTQGGGSPRARKGVTGGLGEDNEILFDEGLGLNDVAGIMAPSPDAKAVMIAKFQKEGIESLNGIPLDDLIQVETTRSRHQMAQNFVGLKKGVLP